MSDVPTPTQSPQRSRGTAARRSAGSGACQITPVQPPSAADAEVLARAQAGDHQAFAQLYSLHKRRIYSLCLRMVGNIAEAEDLTQEAFLAVASQDRHLSRRLGLFHLAAPAGHQRGADATAQEGPVADFAG